MTVNRWQGFDPGPVHMGFVVQNVELGQAFNILNILYETCRFSLHYHAMLIHALITS
jgi:hypothetical protein